MTEHINSKESGQVEWLSIVEARNLANVCDKTIRNWLEAGKIVGQYSKGRRRWRVSKQSLLEHIEFK